VDQERVLKLGFHIRGDQEQTYILYTKMRFSPRSSTRH
jgi:hypothetical protein